MTDRLDQALQDFFLIWAASGGLFALLGYGLARLYDHADRQWTAKYGNPEDR